jgi:hypothetical protein
MRTRIAVMICLSLLAGVHTSHASWEDNTKATPEEMNACQAEAKAYHAAYYKQWRAQHDATWAKWVADAKANPNMEYKLRLHKKEHDDVLRWETDINAFAFKNSFEATRADLIREIADLKKQHAKDGPTAGWPAGHALNMCVFELRLAKLDGKPFVRNAPAAPSTTSPATPSQQTSNAPPAKASATPNAPATGLTPQQIAACSEEIRRKQLESQSWPGDANIVAARLGQFQKDLFEGRCAGHPEAQAYLAGANKMLGYGGSAAAGATQGGTKQAGASGDKESSGGKLAPLRPGMKSTEHNPVHNATNCVKIYGPDEMKARGMHGVLPSTMVNTCPYAISVTWCVAAGKNGPGDCNPGYSNLANLSGAGQPGSNSYGVDANDQMVHYAACRHGENMGFQAVELDPRQPFRFSCS